MASLDRVKKDQRIVLLKYSEKKIKILLRLHPIQLQGYISFMQKSIKSVYGEQKNQSVLNKPGNLLNLMFSLCHMKHRSLRIIHQKKRKKNMKTIIMYLDRTITVFLMP